MNLDDDDYDNNNNNSVLAGVEWLNDSLLGELEMTCYKVRKIAGALAC
jgi:hypothetical protein